MNTVSFEELLKVIGEAAAHVQSCGRGLGAGEEGRRGKKQGEGGEGHQETCNFAYHGYMDIKSEANGLRIKRSKFKI